MSRAFSIAAMAALMGAETSEVFLAFLELSGSGIDTMRIVNNSEDVVVGPNTYYAFPFKVTLAPDTREGPGQATVEVCNVDRQASAILRQLVPPMTVSLSVALASTPTVIELGPLDYTLESSQTKAQTVQLVLSQEDCRLEPIPSGTFTPGRTPGVFKA